jgi:hypothetical protein
LTSISFAPIAALWPRLGGPRVRYAGNEQAADFADAMLVLTPFADDETL